MARTSAASLWVRSIARRYRGLLLTTIAFAGIGGAAVATPWQYARRAEDAVGERFARLGEPDGSAIACPPGSQPTDITGCFVYDDNVEVYNALAASPHAAGVLLTVYASADVTAPTGEVAQVFTLTTPHRHGLVDELQVVEGRNFDPAADDEVVLSERAAAALALGVGDSLSLAACDLRFFDADAPCDAPTSLQIVGIVRPTSNLRPAEPSLNGALAVDSTGIGPSTGWFHSYVRDHSVYTMLTFTLDPGASIEQVGSDLEAGLPGWLTYVSPYEGRNEGRALARTVRLQSRALSVIALVMLVAGCVFVGQALARQARRELSDAPLIATLGAEPGMAAQVAARRAVTVAAGAALVAVVITFVASAFGPTGLAGRVELDHGIRADWLVLTTTFVGIFVLVGATSVALGLRAARVRRRRPSRVRRPGRTARIASLLPTVPRTGLAVDRATSGRASRWAALVGVAVAVAAAVAAGTATASLQRVLTEPVRYGATWTFGVANAESEEEFEPLVERAQADELVLGAAFLASSGPIDLGPLGTTDVVTFVPVKGGLGPVIVFGRAPVADDEVVVGRLTLADLGLDIGDTLPLLPTDAAEDPSGPTVGPLRIVGTALVNDSDVAESPGRGLIVTSSTFEELAVLAGAGLVVSTDPDVPQAEMAQHLAETYEGLVTLPGPHSDLANVDEISSAPWVIAGLVALLATGALIHALVVAIPRRRRSYATLRALGFNRAQVRRATWWPTVLGIVGATVVGVLVGVIVGRLAWSFMRDEIGLDSGAVVPFGATSLIVATTVVFGSLLAIWPAWQAGRGRVTEALRAE